MKRHMSYDELTGICGNMVDSYIKRFNPDEIVAVVRGGTIPATIIAKMLRKPLGVFYPGNTPKYYSHEPNPSRIAIIEDLVAQGRTKLIVDEYFTNLGVEYLFLPILVDENYQGEIDGYGLKTKDWVVFPWEEYEKVVEGDRGLFRDRTDKYDSKD